MNSKPHPLSGRAKYKVGQKVRWVAGGKRITGRIESIFSRDMGLNVWYAVIEAHNDSSGEYGVCHHVIENDIRPKAGR